MKNIKSFKIFELSGSESERTHLLKQYFMNIEDDYDIEVHYNETTHDYFNIIMIFPNISNELNELNTRYKHISEILSLVQRNTKKIEEDFIIDQVEVYQNRINFNLYYNVGDVNNLSIDQLFILDDDEFVVRLNQYKIKKAFKEIHNLDVSTIIITGEADSNEDPYSKISVKVENINLGKAAWFKKKDGGEWKGKVNSNSEERANQMIEEWQNIYGLSSIQFIPFASGSLINFLLEVPVEI